VDFVHQFCQPVVSKEDKTLAWVALGLLFCVARGVCGRVFPHSGHSIRRQKCTGFDSPRGF
jgi:hypothetical protein